MEIAPLTVNALRSSLAVLVPYIVRNLGAKQLRKMIAKLRRANLGDSDSPDDDQRIDPYWTNGFQMISLNIYASQLKVIMEITIVRDIEPLLHSLFSAKRAL